MTAPKKIPWLRIGAESVAIVVSILLAFAIDAWYDASMERRAARAYEERIAVELRAVRGDLERLARGLRRAIDLTENVAAYFEGANDEIDDDRLISSLYNIGRDYRDPFDISTYQELVSSGRLSLIADPDKRQAVQRAYELIPRVDDARYPYREEYETRVRAWIPESFARQIRERCPGMADVDWNCPSIQFDETIAASVVERLDTDESMLGFLLRARGLVFAEEVTLFVLRAVDDVLILFDSVARGSE